MVVGTFFKQVASLCVLNSRPNRRMAAKFASLTLNYATGTTIFSVYLKLLN